MFMRYDDLVVYMTGEVLLWGWKSSFAGQFSCSLNVVDTSKFSIWFPYQKFPQMLPVMEY